MADKKNIEGMIDSTPIMKTMPTSNLPNFPNTR